MYNGKLMDYCKACMLHNYITSIQLWHTPWIIAHDINDMSPSGLTHSSPLTSWDHPIGWPDSITPGWSSVKLGESQWDYIRWYSHDINGDISHRIHGAGIYANIWGMMVNVTIYSIHGSYGYGDTPALASSVPVLKSPYGPVKPMNETQCFVGNFPLSQFWYK